MKYQVQQISYDYRTFDDIKASTWIFTTSEIHTDKGKLDILDFQEVEQNGQVGIQMSVEGWLDLDQYNSSSPLDGPINVRTLAIMREPHNVWLWVYMFDECDRPIAAFCGTDGFDESNSFARYVQELHHKTHDELNIPPTKYEDLKPLMFVIRKKRMCKEDSFKTLLLQNNNKQLLTISIGQCQH